MRGGSSVMRARCGRRQRLLLSGLILGAMVYGGAVGISGAAPSGQQFDGTIKFGAAMSVTGGLAAEAKTSKNGYDFIAAEINKKGGIPVGKKRYRVQIVYYDDASNANTSVQLYEKLINEDKVNFLLGPYSSGVTLATSTVAEKYKIPMVVAHAASPAIYNRGYKYVFGVLNTVSQYSEPFFRMLKTIKTKPPKTVAILYENVLFQQAFADARSEERRVGKECR